MARSAEGCLAVAIGENRRPHTARGPRIAQLRRLIQAIRDSDEGTAEAALMRLSRSRRLLRPVVFAVGAAAMLFEGVRLLFSNWRLTLIEMLPAMWVWLAMLDLKLHLLQGRTFHLVYGAASLAAVAGITAITAASFFLNAVFAFAIARPGPPQIRPGLHAALARRKVILGWGTAAGLCLGMAAVIFPHWGKWWFATSLSAVIAAMMIGYVAVPSRLIGMKTAHSRRDQLTASAVGAAVGAVICAPGYALGRAGISLLGSRSLIALGVIMLTVGLALQAGTTGAVKAVQMSAKLMSGHRHDPGGGA